MALKIMPRQTAKTEIHLLWPMYLGPVHTSSTACCFAQDTQTELHTFKILPSSSAYIPIILFTSKYRQVSFYARATSLKNIAKIKNKSPI
jgi:hypothetical protein